MAWLRSNLFAKHIVKSSAASAMKTFRKACNLTLSPFFKRLGYYSDRIGPPRSIVPLNKNSSEQAIEFVPLGMEEGFQMPSRVDLQNAKPLWLGWRDTWHTRPSRFLLSMSNARYHGPTSSIISEGGGLVEDLLMIYANHFQRVSRVDKSALADFFFHPPVEELPGVTALLDANTCGNYYHFLFDMLPKFCVLQECTGKIPTIDRFILPLISAAFADQWLDLMDLPSDQRLRRRIRMHVRCEKLLVPSLNDLSGYPSRQSIQFLRKVAGKIKPTHPCKIYICRQGSQREFANGPDVARILRSHGYLEVQLEGMAVRDQIAMFKAATHVFGLHGAGFANITFTQPGARVREVLVRDESHPMYSLIAEHLDLKYGCLVADTNSSRVNGSKSKVHLDLNTLECFLED